MRKFFSKKRLFIPAAVAALMVVGVAAYAFWTTTGSGQGSATVAADNGTLVIHATAPSGLTPGDSQDITFTVDNDNSSSLYVDTIHLDSVDADNACDVADFSMDDVVEGATVPASTDGYAMPNKGTLTFADTEVNQDACKSANLTLTFSSN
jgi:hypothetical protein